MDHTDGFLLHELGVISEVVLLMEYQTHYVQLNTGWVSLNSPEPLSSSSRKISQPFWIQLWHGFGLFVFVKSLSPGLSPVRFLALPQTSKVYRATQYFLRELKKTTESQTLRTTSLQPNPSGTQRQTAPSAPAWGRSQATWQTDMPSLSVQWDRKSWPVPFYGQHLFVSCPSLVAGAYAMSHPSGVWWEESKKWPPSRVFPDKTNPLFHWQTWGWECGSEGDRPVV